LLLRVILQQLLRVAARSLPCFCAMSASAPLCVVTGGTGYIGSHTVLSLLASGWDVLAVDNLANSSRAVLPRLASLASAGLAASGRRACDALRFAEVDLRDAAAVRALFAAGGAGAGASAVIHFAGYKAVGESSREPLLYYDNNVVAAVSLLAAMRAAGVRTLVFSSSCTVYGASASPLTEASPAGAGITNAYARSKWHIECMLRDLAAAEPGAWRIAILRYFNPVGAHASGTIGEDPRGVPNCLMPFVAQVLVGRRPHLTQFGDDYPTRDGTPVRDYIHVEDVARGHVLALDWMRGKAAGAAPAAPAAPAPAEDVEVFNFGTGRGVTVKELVAAMERAAGKAVPVVVGPRRAGDLPESFCLPDKAARVLGWRAERSLDDMCADAWRWQAANPMGYDTAPAGEAATA
jgi:UDP-glucose 4-epimerase